MQELQPEQKLCRRDREKLRKQALNKRLRENPEFVAKEKLRQRKRSQDQEKLCQEMYHVFIPALRECLGLDPRRDVWGRIQNGRHTTPMG